MCTLSEGEKGKQFHYLNTSESHLTHFRNVTAVRRVKDVWHAEFGVTCRCQLCVDSGLIHRPKDVQSNRFLPHSLMPMIANCCLCRLSRKYALRRSRIYLNGVRKRAWTFQLFLFFTLPSHSTQAARHLEAMFTPRRLMSDTGLLNRGQR